MAIVKRNENDVKSEKTFHIYKKYSLANEIFQWDFCVF